MQMEARLDAGKVGEGTDMDTEDDEQDGVSDCAITTRLDGEGPPQGWMFAFWVDVFPGDWGSRGRGHPPDSQSLLSPEHHPTQHLFPFMETALH